MPASKQVEDLRGQRDSVAEPERPQPDRSRFEPLAARAIDMIVARRSGRTGLSEHWLAALHDAVVGPDPAARNVVFDRMLAAELTAEQVCDHYVPAVARRLGDEWCDDTMSFADVSIGAARLQALLRDVAFDPDQEPVDESGRITVLVVADEFHPLGAMVVTGQLRRRGASVRLLLSRRREEIERQTAGCGFDAVLVSAAKSDDPGVVKQMLTMLRELIGVRVPFVIGGGLLDIGVERVLAETGADHATSDPLQVMRLIGFPETAWK